jgi:putative lipoic acid-binding regulatory protein
MGRVSIRARAEPSDDGEDEDEAAYTPEWAKDLIIDERGDLVDATTGKPLNEFGATRFDLYVRALRGEYDVRHETTEKMNGEIYESIAQFPSKYTFQVSCRASDAADEAFKAWIVNTIAGDAGEAKCEVEVRPRGTKFASIWITCFVFSAREVNAIIDELKEDERVKMCC